MTSNLSSANHDSDFWESVFLSTCLICAVNTYYCLKMIFDRSITHTQQRRHSVVFLQLHFQRRGLDEDDFYHLNAPAQRRSYAPTQLNAQYAKLSPQI